jgi:hypothetical protein
VTQINSFGTRTIQKGHNSPKRLGDCPVAGNTFGVIKTPCEVPKPGEIVADPAVGATPTVRGTDSDGKLQSAQPWREIDHCRFLRDLEVAADPVFDLAVENTSGGPLLLSRIGIRILCLEKFCDPDSASSSEIRFFLQTSRRTVESESIWLEQ